MNMVEAAGKIAPSLGAEDLIANTARLAPQIEAAAGEIERLATLPDGLVGALFDAGLYRMLIPSELGGAQLDPISFVRIMETIARADASTAWCIGQTASCSMAAANLHPRVAAEIFLNPNAVLAWGPGKGRADIEGDSYRLTGEWNFASGSGQANWLGGLATVFKDGREVIGKDGRPLVRTLLFPASSATFKHVWEVVGLKGTGSEAYSVAGISVPLTHSIIQDDAGERTNDGPLYALTSRNIYAIGFAAIAIGVSSTILDIFIDIARNKVPKGRTASLKDNANIQMQVALGSAAIASSREYLLGAVRRVWAGLVDSRAASLSTEDRVALRLAASYAIRECYKVADFAFHAAGATAIFSGNPIERRFRDMIALRQHIQGRDDLFEICGQFLLGDTPDFLTV